MTGRTPLSPALTLASDGSEVLADRVSRDLGRNCELGLASRLLRLHVRLGRPAGLVDLGHQARVSVLGEPLRLARRHQVDRDLPVELRRRTLRDDATEVEHDDPVGYLEDVVHVVGDEQRRVPLLGEPAGEVQHHPRLGDAERSRRLVHDHQLRFPEHGLRDRHRLPLAARERGHRLADRAHGRHGEAGEGLAGRFLHRLLVEEDAVLSLPSQEHVLHDVQVVTEREILVDGLDPERGGLARGANPNRLSVPEDLPALRSVDPGDALDHHRLAGPVVADERGHLACPYVQVHVDERLHRPEVLRDAAEAKERLCAVLAARHRVPSAD